MYLSSKLEKDSFLQPVLCQNEKTRQQVYWEPFYRFFQHHVTLPVMPMKHIT